MEFDLCQKNRAKELLLSENRAVWPLQKWGGAHGLKGTLEGFRE